MVVQLQEQLLPAKRDSQQYRPYLEVCQGKISNESHAGCCSAAEAAVACPARLTVVRLLHVDPVLAKRQAQIVHRQDHSIPILRTQAEYQHPPSSVRDEPREVARRFAPIRKEEMATHYTGCWTTPAYGGAVQSEFGEMVSVA